VSLEWSDIRCHATASLATRSTLRHAWSPLAKVSNVVLARPLCACVCVCAVVFELSRFIKLFGF